MTLFIYIALFLLVCFLFRDRLGQRMTEALADGVSTLLWLSVLLFLYFIFFHDR